MPQTLIPRAPFVVLARGGAYLRGKSIHNENPPAIPLYRSPKCHTHVHAMSAPSEAQRFFPSPLSSHRHLARLAREFLFPPSALLSSFSLCICTTAIVTVLVRRKRQRQRYTFLHYAAEDKFTASARPKNSCCATQISRRRQRSSR